MWFLFYLLKIDLEYVALIFDLTRLPIDRNKPLKNMDNTRIIRI